MAFERQTPHVTWVTIAIGVFIGTAGIHVLEAGLAKLYLQYQIESAAAELRRLADESNKDARARYEAQEQAQEQQRQNLAAQQRQDALERQAEIDAKTRKENAWAHFYKRPKECDDNPNTETFTRCANDSIRARTQFEGTYKP